MKCSSRAVGNGTIYATRQQNDKFRWNLHQNRKFLEDCIVENNKKLKNVGSSENKKIM
jgi:hypothetical protein